MFCPHCGKEIADGSYICPNCGATVDEQPQQPAQQPQQQPNQYNPQYQQQPQYNKPATMRSNKKNVCSIIGLVFACIVALIVVINNTVPFAALNMDVDAAMSLLGFLSFLGVFGTILMWSGLVLAIVGMVLAFTNKCGQRNLAIATLVVIIVVIVLNFVLNAVIYAAYFK